MNSICPSLCPAPVMEWRGLKRPIFSHGMERPSFSLCLSGWVAHIGRGNGFSQVPPGFPLHRRDYLHHILISGRGATVFAAAMPCLLLNADALDEGPCRLGWGQSDKHKKRSSRMEAMNPARYSDKIFPSTQHIFEFGPWHLKGSTVIGRTV